MCDLKPCPFCGSNVQLSHPLTQEGRPEPNLPYWSVECLNGTCIMSWGFETMESDRQLIVRSWNQRVGTTTQHTEGSE